MAIGDGCLKPLNRTYGACQYQPNEAKSVALFFVLYYFVYNIGSIVSRLVSPVLREDVQCFGNDDCFTAAFGISGICMILVALLTVMANRYSETTQADGSSLLNVFACIWVQFIKELTESPEIHLQFVSARGLQKDQIETVPQHPEERSLVGLFHREIRKDFGVGDASHSSRARSLSSNYSLLGPVLPARITVGVPSSTNERRHRLLHNHTGPI